MNLITLLLSLFTLMNPNEKKGIEIPSIFSDNMVLQQNTDVSFWGKAEPNLKVDIKASWGESANTIVNADGKWLVKIKTPKAGGPFEVNLQIGDSAITYENVLTGEVWLGSGQSNMEMPLRGWPPNDTILNSSEEIKNANYPQIRFFTVSRAISNEREFNLNGKWDECNPATAEGFSATAYFFGRKLHQELKVPIGLIHSSWGGTPVESWINGDFLSRVEEYKSIISDVENSTEETRKYNKWLFSHPVIDVSSKPEAEKWKNLEFDDMGCAETNFQDDDLKEMNLPVLWESTEVGNFDGVIWFRKEILIPANWTDKDLIVELGPIDDIDRTYVNGKLIGGYETDGYWNTDRVYKVPKEIVESKNIVIAVRVIDIRGGGGIYGSKEKLKIHPADSDESISLSGSWKYLPVAEYREPKFYVFGVEGSDYYSKPPVKIGLSDHTPTVLFNAMINPLIPFPIKGVIWYQGESNTGDPEMYATLFPLMIKNWRSEWQNDFPFYYVQIAPYDYGDDTHSERLRETQLKSLSVPNTGMAVTLDIGNANNIHPAYKQEVGERLASWALAETYDKDVPYSGPLYKSMKIENDKIILSFDYSDGGLIIKEANGENNFLIAGEDKVFKKASVKVDGDKLILYSSEIKNPLAVRYTWSNTAEATLFNKAGLPASTFRTDDWSH
jgi:sialate O-acetylesterase